MMRRRTATVLLTLVAAGLLAPAGAGAQTPFAPLPPAQTDQATTQALPTTTNAADQGGLDRWQEILIFLGGVVFVLGIGWAVLRDAKRAAPVEDEAQYYRDTAEKAPIDPRRKAKNRKKAKAQRAARRQNR